MPILFDGNRAIDVGLAQYPFTGHQRVALAAEWGGCGVDGCDRPASWTEAHHIEPWSRGGRTDLRNGVLLCRFHHMWLHNGHWRIEKRGGELWVVPPPGDTRTEKRLVRRNPIRR
ncbi:MAG: HNH endonuclease [Leifsonia sp.]|nr:HNH endonuclease [Leifsonia sp.]